MSDFRSFRVWHGEFIEACRLTRGKLIYLSGRFWIPIRPWDMSGYLSFHGAEMAARPATIPIRRSASFP